MSHLLKSVEDGVMKITLNRPDAMNALSRDMLNSLTDALNEAAGSRDIGCVVVRGSLATACEHTTSRSSEATPGTVGG